MNKKFQKGIVAAMAATMGTGIVAPVYAAQAATTDLAAQYAAAYNATTNALSTKNQKDLTAARVLVDGLYNVVKGTADEYLATTLSQLLDPAQQVKLVDLDNAIKAAEKSVAQADVNKARALIVDMPTVWKNSFSSYIDGIQQQIITRTADAIKAAQEAGEVDAYNKASVALNELLTVTNNDGVKSFAEGALKAELAKVVAVSGVSVASDKEVVVSFVNAASADAEDFQVTDKTVEAVKASGNTLTLTVNSSFADGKEYSVTFKGKTKTFVYKVASPEKISLTQSTFEGKVGLNIRDYVQVKDSNGQVVSEEDYTIGDVQSSDTQVVEDFFGTIRNRGTVNVRVRVDYKNGESQWSDFFTVNVNTPALGKSEGWTFEAGVKSTYANTLAFVNSGDEDHDVTVGEQAYVHLFKSDSAGNPLAKEIDLGSDKVTVSGYDATKLNVVHSTDGIRVEGKRLGTTSLTIKGEDFTETITVTVKAAPVLDGFKTYSNVSLLPNAKSGAVVATDYHANAKQLQADILSGVVDGEAAALEEGIDTKTFSLLNFKDQYGETFGLTADGVVDNGFGRWTISTKNGGVVTVSMAQGQFDAWNTNGGSIEVGNDGKMTVVAPTSVAVSSFDVSLAYFSEYDSYIAANKADYKTSFKLGVLNTDGKIASYKVTATPTTIDSSAALAENREAKFTAVALDKNGNVLSKQATDMVDIRFDDATKLTSDQKTFIDYEDKANAADRVFFENRAADYLDQNGAVKIQYAVVKSSSDQAAGVIAINYTNSRLIPVSAVLPTAVTVDLSNTNGSVSLRQILLGIVNEKELNLDSADDLSMGAKVGYDGYVQGFAPRLVLKAEGGEVLSLGASIAKVLNDNNTSVLNLGYTEFGTDNLMKLKFGNVHYTNVDGINIDDVNVVDAIDQFDASAGYQLSLKPGLEKGTLTVDIDGLYIAGDTRANAKNLLGGKVTIKITILK